MPLVSIIVPVYNVEKYLPRCIDSILGQTYTDLELILIDDGSHDSSGHICDEYALKDKRIRVFHKDNAGVSAARNLGISKAAGNWIMFVDSDDWVDINAIKYASKYFEENDLIRFSYKSVFAEDEQRNEDFKLKMYYSKESFISDVITQRTYVAVWGTLYKRDLFTPDVQFDPAISIGEDWLIFVKLLNNSHSFRTIDKPIYFYNQYKQNGCTSLAIVKKKCTVFLAIEQIEENVDKKIHEKELQYIKLIQLYSILMSIIFLKERTKMIAYTFEHVSVCWNEILTANINFKIRFFLFVLFLYRRVIFV